MFNLVGCPKIRRLNLGEKIFVPVDRHRWDELRKKFTLFQVCEQ